MNDVFVSATTEQQRSAADFHFLIFLRRHGVDVRLVAATIVNEINLRAWLQTLVHRGMIVERGVFAGFKVEVALVAAGVMDSDVGFKAWRRHPCCEPAVV